MTGDDLAAEVASELVALDWTSHGNGATVPELVGALQLRGVLATINPLRASALVARAVLHVPHRVASDDSGNLVTRPVAEGPLRGDWAVVAPR